MLSGALAVAIAVPLATQKPNTNKFLDQAIEILDEAPIFDGYGKI